ncbi:hypothetical protein MHYP_G00150160 [Metynnis hypsauchen]
MRFHRKKRGSTRRHGSGKKSRSDSQRLHTHITPALTALTGRKYNNCHIQTGTYTYSFIWTQKELLEQRIAVDHTLGKADLSGPIPALELQTQ